MLRELGYFSLADPGGVTWGTDPPKICSRPQIRYRLYSVQLDKITFLLILLLHNVKI